MNNTYPGQILHGCAIHPQAATAGTPILGSRIISPGTIARKIGFTVMCGTLTGVTVLTIKVQYSQDGGTTWSDLLQSDGTTPMSFTASKTIAGSGLDNGVISGSLELSRSNHGDYRLAMTTLTGGNTTIAAAYTLFDSPRKPIQDPVTDDLLAKQLIALQGNNVSSLATY